jgi:S1-C subfamily serine protease
MYTNHKVSTRVGILAAIVVVFALAGCQVPTVNGVSALLPAPRVVNAPAPSNGTANGTTSATVTTNKTTAASPLGDFTNAIRVVTQKVKPAVVQITNQQVQFDQFSNQEYDIPAGVGSGVIYDNQGHILTNNHVVEGASQLLVSLPDGRSLPAKLIGADPQTDLAVVQISGNNLPVAPLGDSGRLQVGDWVVAIGNALALPGGPTVTAGVVSALDRTVQEPGDTTGNGFQTSQGPFLFDVIQTSAPINPGNSGGPLLTLAGQVIGINTLVAGQAEPGVSAQGIGFAISIDAAKPIADQLVATGHVVHTYLGVSYVTMNPAVAAQLSVTPDTMGVAVVQVLQGSPAAQAGLQRRDVITAIDGKALQDDTVLQQTLALHKPGDTVTLTVQRGSQKLTVTVKLAERPASLGNSSRYTVA